MRNLIFLLSEAQRNLRNELFDSIEAQRNSAIAERYFRTKLKRNLTSAIEISQHNANTAFFAILDWKRVNNLLNKPEIYQYYNGNGVKLNSMHRIALLTEKNFESATQLKRNKLWRLYSATQLPQCFKTKNESATQLTQLRRLRKLRFALLIALCPHSAYY